MSDPYNLDRFVQAQTNDYARALAEIRRGRKASHWMWYIFPQLAGLGRSTTAVEFAITSAAEAEAYLRHPVLGPRLREIAEEVLKLEARSPEAIFDHDAIKLHSSATLFAQVSPPGSVFHRVLHAYFGGKPDRSTLDLLGVRPEGR